MSDYEYDENLPYVVPYGVGEIARFSERTVAVRFSHEYTSHSAIDTTPKPHVPDDAEWIMWTTQSDRSWVAQRNEKWWATKPSGISVPLEDLPGVTPDTVFTVLDERKSDD